MGFMDKLSEVNAKMGKTIQESLESTLNFDLKPKDGKMHPLIVAMKGFISIKNFTTGIKVDSRRVDYLDRVLTVLQKGYEIVSVSRTGSEDRDEYESYLIMYR